MNGTPARSLGRRLSWWLAIQTFAGLAVVCLAVYMAMAMNVHSRQEEEILQKQAVVRHVLGEVAPDDGIQTLKHKLDDMLVGHDNLALALASPGREPLYRSKARDAPPRRTRQSTFDVGAPLSAGGSLTATLTLDTGSDERLLHKLGITLAAAAVAGALLVSAGGFRLVRRGLSPVRHLVDQTRRLGADTLAQRLDGSGQPEELQPLVQQFNELLGRLDAAYAQLEGFNADVAHELCTPLATLIGGSELALRGQHRADELLDVLGSNLEELRRIAAIVTDMLFLSQADRGAVARREPVSSLAAVARGVLEFHEAILDEERLRTEVEGDVRGSFDVPLLRRALSNLVSNASRYAVPGSVVRVVLATRADGLATVAVANRGAPIALVHQPRLFDRFYRADSARGHADRNHGLGLAIVAAIARMHGGRPFVHCGDGLTTIGFELRTRG